MGIEFTLKGRPRKTGLLKREPAKAALKALADAAIAISEVPARLHEAPTHLLLFFAGCEILLWTERGHVMAYAKTSPFGTGFHMHVLDVLHRAGAESGIEWDAKAQREFNADPKVVRAEMSLLLRAICGHVWTTHPEDGSINMDARMRFQWSGVCHTPLGPRSPEWIESVASGVGTGQDCQPWPDPGTGPSFRFGRAMHMIWCHVPWTEPYDEEVEDIYNTTSSDLASVMDMPDYDIPWHEWKELIDLGAGADAGVRQRVEAECAQRPAPERRIGYRREPVMYISDTNFSVTVPGTMRGVFANGWQVTDEHFFLGITSIRGAENTLIPFMTKLFSGDPFKLDFPFPVQFYREEHNSPYDGGHVLFQGVAQYGRAGALFTLSGAPESEERMRAAIDTLTLLEPLSQESIPWSSPSSPSVQ